MTPTGNDNENIKATRATEIKPGEVNRYPFKERSKVTPWTIMPRFYWHP